MDSLPLAFKSINSILKQLEGEWWKKDQNLKHLIMMLQLDFKLLKTLLNFLSICKYYVKMDSTLLQFLFHLANELEETAKSLRRLRAASPDNRTLIIKWVSAARRRVPLDTAVSDLQQKIELLRAKVKGACDYIILNFSDQSQLYFPKFFGFVYFVKDVQQNLLSICNFPGSNLPPPVVKQLESLAEYLEFCDSFLWSIHKYEIHLSVKSFSSSNPLQTIEDFWAYFGAAVISASHVCHLCWVDKMDGQKMVIMLSNVQKALKFNGRKAIDIILKLFASSKSKEIGTVIYVFISLLINGNPELKKSSGTGNRIRKGLDFLLQLFIEAPDLYEEDVTLILMHIIEVSTHVESLSNSFNNPNLAVLMLVENVELFKAEVLLKGLLEQRAGLVVPVKEQINSIIEGLSFLGTYDFQDLPEAKTEGSKMYRMHIEEVVRQAGSLYDSFHAKEVTEERLKHGLLKLLDKIKLFKLEALVKRLLINGNPSLMVSEKDQIKTLYEGLIFLRSFIMIPLVENDKLLWTSAESVSTEVGSFYYSFHACENAEEVSRKMNSLLSDVLIKIMLFEAEVRKIYEEFRSSVPSNFPRTHGLDFVDFLIGNLRELLNNKVDAIASVKHHIEIVHHDMKVFRSFLEDISKQFIADSELKNLQSRVIDVANQAEYLIDTFVVKGAASWCHVQWLSNLVEEIKLIKIHTTEITEKKTYSIDANTAPETLRSTTLPVTTPRIEDVIVDLPDQAELIIDRLTRGTLHQDIVAIVGMPGLGKTTLARNVYNEPSIMYHFHIRAWAYVSQAYQKRNLLIDILRDINVDHSHDISKMSDEDLDLELYQCLKGRKYLIVMDDMWSIEAWSDLERSFPDDQNGSRILITSRYHDVALKAKPNSSPHHLRQLTDDESWELLWKKLFETENFPEELLKVGEQIAKNCKGLPLAVVAIAGLLKVTDKVDWWKQVAESLSSLIVGDPRTRCMDILDLSYKHLPHYLKPCFLYLGSFQEDKEIPVSKLKLLWIAEGFVQNRGTEILDSVAEKYLVDLIDRSLVMVAKRRSRSNKVKTCRVHDMLRDLCFAKCKEENFSQLISGYDEVFASSSENLDYGVDPDYNYPSNTITYEEQRLSICSKRNHFVMSRPSGRNTRSLLFFAKSDSYPTCPYDVAFICDNFKLLRVLDLECINMGNSFPKGIELLVHLRYLAMSGDINSIPSSIDNLLKLETFIVKGLRGKVVLPESIWSMKRLRHVHVNSHSAFRRQDEHGNLSQLDNLVTLSSPTLSYGKETEKILTRLPNLQKLRCNFSESMEDVGQRNRFPVLEFLMKLESLKIFYSCRIPYLGEFDFPVNLKKLTLSNFRLPWENISEIGKLPKLEVLKLLYKAFEGETWDMREGEFQELKFLKLDSLNIAEWNAFSDHLPKLQRLVLRNCKQLEEVPYGFADISTLEMIEVQFCKRSAEESVKTLKEDFEELKIVINLSEYN